MSSTLAHPSNASAGGPTTSSARTKLGLGVTPLPPLPDLLVSGGDDRLKLVSGGINAYGCAASPRPDIAEFASSTATTISERAFRHAEKAQAALIDIASAAGVEIAVESRTEAMRQELHNVLGLEPGTAVVFAPSGTDAALYATFLATALFGAPLANIMMTSDETGSGIPFASLGRHFSTCTALGAEVAKGDLIEGFSPNVAVTGFPGRDSNGHPLDAAMIDEAVLAAVQHALTKGSRVVLHAMDCSRTGLVGPSLECLDHITSLWSDSVLVVVDACQMRLSRSRLNGYLARNFLVLVTGSKFFTGPPFSGALLVPEELSEVFARIDDVPDGLRSYTNRSCWPQTWTGIRSRLTGDPNYGALLRWEAALAEIRAFFDVPETFRTECLSAFDTRLKLYLSSIEGIEAAPTSSAAHDGELLRRSIVPFVLKARQQVLSLDDALKVYRAMNEEIALAAPGACHFGQPVALALGDGGVSGAFRASLSARTVSQAWVTGDPAASQRNLEHTLDGLGEALRRIARFSSTLATR